MAGGGGGSLFTKIKVDDTRFYLQKTDELHLYTLAGVYELTISESGIQTFDIKDGDIYTVTASKVKKYDSSGVFQEEFDITETIEDCIII